ncbi:MAG: adenylate/guanylate cyclase domain-containing protein [Spirulina sp. SIO3F2]|nr:adenylate/guanylate cyclase domain-containing protein [Spirulina sp. SIO3F2]
MKRPVSIGFKIFGIAASMLGLLLVVVQVSTHRLQQVSREIESLAEYIIPITNAVAKVDVHALEQEVLFERILKHYEIEPLDPKLIATETAEFERRNIEVDEELIAAEQRAENALEHLATVTEQTKLAAVIPKLQEVEVLHQVFHDHAVEVLGLLKAGQYDQAHQLERQLADEEAILNQELETILLELEALTVAAAEAGQRRQQTVQRLSVAIALLATVLGGVGAGLVTQGLVRPVRQLTRKMQAIQQGDLNAQAQVIGGDEVATLATAFNQMARELKSKAQLEDTFGKYVDPRVVKQLLARTDSTNITGDRQVMTVFFADVEGFSERTQSLSPEDLVTLTNAYFTLMAQPIGQHLGVLDKFINTIVMGFWGPPFADAERHAELACAAALDLQTQLSKIQALIENQAHLFPESQEDGNASPLPLERGDFYLHVGIATGPLVAGNMGSARAKSYTVMGDTVNTASRLKGVSKQYGVAIALTQETQTRLGDRYATRELDLIQVIGKEEPVRVYELLGEATQIDEGIRQRQQHFAQGLAAYRQQHWDDAANYFAACSTPEQSDPPAQLYLNRIKTLRQQPPAADWDGVWRLTKK